MPVIKRSKKTEKKKSFMKAKRERLVKEDIDVSLPTEPDEPSLDLAGYSILIHGEKKIGKTSLFAQEEGAFFMEWDPKQTALPILQRMMPDWETFRAYLAKLTSEAKRGRLKYTTIVVDGADIMYRKCFKYVCSTMGIEHPNDENDWGKSWSAIREEFEWAVRELMSLPDVSVRFICHSAWKETKTRSGNVDRLNTLLTGQAEEVLVGLIDIWAAYVYDGSDRILIIQGDETTGAGHRVDHCFRTPSGKAIREIHMGTSPSEAYANFTKAFQNQQTYVEVADMKKRKESAGKKKGILVMRKKK